MLEDQLIPIDFGGGIDQRADRKQTIPTKMERLENAVLIKGKSVQKRYGYSTVSPGSRDFGGTSYITASMIDSVDGRIVCSQPPSKTATTAFPGIIQRDYDLMFGVSPNTLSARAPFLGIRGNSVQLGSARCPTQPINGATTLCDMVMAQNTQLGLFYYAYEEAGRVVLSRFERETNTQDALALSVSNRTRPRVLADSSGNVLFGCVNTTSGEIEIRVPGNSLYTMSSSVALTLTSILGSAPHWDWANIGGTAYLAWNQSATQIKYAAISFAGASITVGSFGSTVALNAICVANSSTTGNDQVRVLWQENTNGIRIRYFNSGTMAPGSAYGGSNLAITTGTTQVEQLTAAYGLSSYTNALLVIAQYTAATTVNRFCIGTWFTDGAPPTQLSGSVSQLAGGLVSKVTMYEGRATCGMVHDSPLQKQIFWAEWTRLTDGNVQNSVFGVKPLARTMFGVTRGLVNAPHLPEVTRYNYQDGVSNDIVSYSYFACLRNEQQIFSSGSTISALAAPGYCVVDHRQPGRFRGVEVDGALLMQGGFIGNMDGAPALIENNFWMWPEGLTLSTTTSGGAISAGVYQYTACYEWTDSKGKLHRSAPGVPQTITVSGTTTGLVTVSAPSLRWSYKDSLLTRNRFSTPRVSLWRTEASGTIFYRVTDVPSAITTVISNNTASTVADTISDTALISRDILYTQGGELPNWSPNSGSAIASGQNRVFINDLSDDGVIYYSKAVVTGEALSFALELSKRIPSAGGPITAIVAAFDRVYIFKKRGLWVMSGEGPDPTGTYNDYSEPKQIPIDGGADNQSCVVATPDGIIVSNGSGFKMIGYDLSWRYIGEPVKDYESWSVISSQLIPERSEVRFVVCPVVSDVLVETAGYILHYNYEFLDQDGIGQWSLTRKFVKDLKYSSGDVYVVDSGGQIQRESFDPINSYNCLFYDRSYSGLTAVTTTYSMLAETAWIGVQRQGAQRVRAIYILGELFANTASNGVTLPVTVEIAYDYSSSFSTVSYVASFLSTTNAAQMFQVEIRPQQQKCETIKLRITDTGSGTCGFSLANMTFKLAMKRGGPKLDPSRRAT
jgi:hypothetical protein